MLGFIEKAELHLLINISFYYIINYLLIVALTALNPFLKMGYY